MTPLPEFRLGATEPLPVGLKRLTLNELESATSRFYDGEEAFSEAVHESRKSTKRVRAVLRLVRDEVGDKIYEFEDTWMRDTGRMIAPVRDSFAIVDSFDVLHRIYGHLLVDGALEEVRDHLVSRRDRLENRVMEDPHLVSGVVERLEKAHGRYSNWATEASGRTVYAGGIRDEFSAIRPGFKRTYERGRKQMVHAYKAPSPHNFHEWRKNVKYLRHQMEVMTPLWPEVVVGMAITFERVGEMIGQDHDLSILLDLLENDPNVCPDPIERSLIRALAGQRRSDLQVAARVLGRRVFTEDPESLTGRLEVYWESREPESISALNSVSL